MEHESRHAAWTSVLLLDRAGHGDEQAAQALFLRYFKRLSALVRSRLAPRLRRRIDPEDIVMSVYRSFFVAARTGRFTVARRGDLWRLLSAIVKHKLFRQIRREKAERRSIDNEVAVDAREEARVLDRDRPESPLETIARGDELDWIFGQLEGAARRIFELRLQGAPLAEIAQVTGRSERTIRRTLAQIRELFAKRQGDPCPRLSHQDFSLERMIGAGRMGKVYEARQHSAGRAVAVKFLRKSLLREPSLVARFIDEARIVTRLCHPNIVGVHGMGQTPGGSYFLVMDLVRGPNLAALAERRGLTSGEAVRWTIEICSALEYAHAHGVIHCDLKPANLLVDEFERVRVTDFGLARSLSGLAPAAAPIEGTGPFMAPEQVSRSWGQIGIRTDVYGVGAVLFTLLTGRPPWIGRTLEDILAAVASRTPVIAPVEVRPDIPEALSAICGKCLSKRPDDRYESLKDLRFALGQLQVT